MVFGAVGGVLVLADAWVEADGRWVGNLDVVSADVRDGRLALGVDGGAVVVPGVAGGPCTRRGLVWVVH